MKHTCVVLRLTLDVSELEKHIFKNVALFSVLKKCLLIKRRNTKSEVIFVNNVFMSLVLDD